MKLGSFNLRVFFKTLFSEKPRLAIVTAFIAAVFIGFSGIFVRLSEVGPLASGLFRFFFAVPFLWTWMMFDNAKTKTPRMPTTLKDYALLLLAGFLFAIDIGILNLSLSFTSVMNATLFNNLTAIFVALFAWLVLKESPSPFLIIGIILSIVGSVSLMGQSLNFGSNNLIGDCLALLSSVTYAGYIIVSKYLRNTFTTATVMAWSGLFTFYFMSAFVWLDSGNILPTTFYGWMIVFLLAIVVHVIGQGLMGYSIAYLNSVVTSLILMVGPIAATTAAWFLFDEKLTLIQVGGAFFILISIIISRQTMPLNPEQIKPEKIKEALTHHEKSP